LGYNFFSQKYLRFSGGLLLIDYGLGNDLYFGLVFLLLKWGELNFI
jgi:hypothetical protein